MEYSPVAGEAVVKQSRAADTQIKLFLLVNYYEAGQRSSSHFYASANKKSRIFFAVIEMTSTHPKKQTATSK
jgi:hypothetical protein